MHGETLKFVYIIFMSFILMA